MVDATTGGVTSGTTLLRPGEVVVIREERWRVVRR